MSEPKKSKSLQWSERMAWILDNQYRIPGTDFKFGLDPILGLVPGLGDAISMIFQLSLVFALLRNGSSGKLRALLFVNVMLDTAIGSIPVVGQVFDFFFKASQRNLKLVQEYLYEGKHTGSGRNIWLLLLLLIILAIASITYAFVLFIQWIVSLFT